MNISSKIGQLIMIGFEGTGLTDPLRGLMKEYPFGGVILFSRNYSGREQIRNLCAELQDWNVACHPSSPPLFIGVDQEGGRVKRFGVPFIDSPPNNSWGEMDDPEKTRENAQTVARELREVGVNINFAPVLDVNNNPDNPVIGHRAYGDNPDLVARHGIAAIRGYSEGGVFPVGKHFPGHGRTSVDSHLDLPELDASPEQIREVELPPFVRGIASGLEMIMVAHILFKEVDPRFPATFSKRIVTEILRGEMDFQGLVFTDDMEMGAILKNYDFPEACLLALEAGSDNLLVCHDPHKQKSAFQAIDIAVKSGRLSEKRIDESVNRIMRLKNRIP